MNYFCDVLTANNELVESRLLFRSLVNGEASFKKTFFNLFYVDFEDVFGTISADQFLFNLLKNYYHNDFFIRYSFIKKVLSKSSAISFQEFPISESRLDLASINGKSVAYEIKSDFDNFTRLEKQVLDYSYCFEYVYLICSKKHLQEALSSLPSFCGIYLFKGNGSISFKKYREASLSPNLSSNEMLKLFRIKELKKSFTKQDVHTILLENNVNKINFEFKKTLKERFNEEWLTLKNKALLLQ